MGKLIIESKRVRKETFSFLFSFSILLLSLILVVVVVQELVLTQPFQISQNKICTTPKGLDYESLYCIGHGMRGRHG